MSGYKISDYLDYGEYKTVQGLTSNPRLLTAIGIHETGMGSLGAGRQGYYLGYGVPTTGSPQSQYKGLYNQIKYGTKLAEKYVDINNPTQEQLIKLGLEGWLPGYYDNAGNYVKTGDSWAKSIWNIYNNLTDDYSGISPYNPKEKLPTQSEWNPKSDSGSSWGGRIKDKLGEITNPINTGFDSIKNDVTRIILFFAIGIVALVALVMLLNPKGGTP